MEHLSPLPPQHFSQTQTIAAPCMHPLMGMQNYGPPDPSFLSPSLPSGADACAPDWCSCSTQPRCCAVRFLHAVSGEGPLRIAVGTRSAAPHLSFGGISSYCHTAVGFRTVTISSARTPWVLLCQTAVPMCAGESVTLAIIRSGEGLDLVRIPDAPCGTPPREHACIRAVNLVRSSPPLDLILEDGRVIFTDLYCRAVTLFKQAAAKRYDFHVARTPYTLPPAYDDIAAVDEMPVAVCGGYLPGWGMAEPLAAFSVDANAGAAETVYLLGDWERSPTVSVLIQENF